MLNKLDEQEKELWEQIGQIMQEEMSTVDDVREQLARNEKGLVKQTIDNCIIVLERDPLLKNSICKNELTGKVDIVKDLGWKRKNSSITDMDMYQIQHYLEISYNLTSEKNINKAMHIVASRNSYHPIINFLEHLRWDGKNRIGTLMTKYLGAEDSKYTKEVIQLLMLKKED